VEHLYPLLLEASFHETIWGGRRLERERWKQLPTDGAIGEAWETEVSTRVHNGHYAGQTLGKMVEHWGAALLGQQAVTIFGNRFPLLAKFIDANAQLSVQVHPDDSYAAAHEGGKLGKTECWFILAAEPQATIVHGFKSAVSRQEVAQAIQNVTLDTLLHEEVVAAGDVIFVPAGTVHAIGSGVLLYELQEYSDITYRMYDYGRLSANGQPRELHIEQALAVTHYTPSSKIKVKPVTLASDAVHQDRCLVACRYFVTRELTLKPQYQRTSTYDDQTADSCVILSSLGAEATVRYGTALEHRERISRGQTMVLPAALGTYRIEGEGKLFFSYVPSPEDEAWRLWHTKNEL
jgi:mannose-6-phosphate isomerase